MAFRDLEDNCIFCTMRPYTGRFFTNGYDQRPSDKSYVVAVCLSGIFGLAGIHHFYLGRFIHRLRFGLLVATIYFYFTGIAWAIPFFAVDVLHTFVITIMRLPVRIKMEVAKSSVILDKNSHSTYARLRYQRKGLCTSLCCASSWVRLEFIVFMWARSVPVS